MHSNEVPRKIYIKVKKGINLKELTFMKKNDNS